MADAEQNKADLVYKAKNAEQAERYEDMVHVMKEVAQLKQTLTTDERNLLSVAYKNVVGTRRSSWRVISSIEQKEDDDRKKQQAQEYLDRISGEITQICNEVVELIDGHLLPHVGDDNESKTFYMKMKGDYFRYVAEVVKGDCKKKFAKDANDAYGAAYEICEKEMPEPHPIRLGLALNFSVFHYEIMEDHELACKIAKEAFDKAIKEMENLSRNNFKDSSLIMQLLRDNLTLWTAADNDNDDDEDQDGMQQQQEEPQQAQEEEEKKADA